MLLQQVDKGVEASSAEAQLYESQRLELRATVHLIEDLGEVKVVKECLFDVNLPHLSFFEVVDGLRQSLPNQGSQLLINQNESFSG